MKNEIDNLFKELVTVGIIFVAICFSVSSFQHDLELKRVHKLVEVERIAKIEAMKLAVELNDRLDIHLENNLSLNIEIDRLMNEINEFKDLKKLKKDLR